jgi:HlyD family secretion protein
MNFKTLLLSSAAIVSFSSCGGEERISLVTDTVTTGSISESVTATGTLESVTSVDVGTQVTGIIDKIYVDFNSEVKQGQLIAEIEKVLLQSELESAEANVESARASFAYSAANYERDRKLHERNLISDYDFETSAKDYQLAKTTYDKAKADRVKAAKNLNYAEIYSPIDGIVISRDVEVGQTVVSAMTVANLFTIADLDNMRVVADVDEADIGQVKEGQHVTFTVDAYPEDVFEGIVTQKRLSPTTESNVVTYEVLVSAANPEHKLIPGLTANLTIYMSRNDNAVLVPVKATRFMPHDYPGQDGLPQLAGDTVGSFTPSEPGEKRVWTVDDGKLIPAVIQTGANDGVNMEVVSGLAPGTKLAVEYSVAADNPDMPDGARVRTMGKNERARLRNRKIGFVFQNYNLLPKTSAIENVELPLLYNQEISAAERRERAIKSLIAVGLGERLNHKSNQMSGGQQQRVAIARALVNDPVIILADEATGNLDTRTSFSVLVLFQELYRKGRTIIFVTHNPELAAFSSRNIVLRDGKIISDTLNPSPASAKEMLESLPSDDD